MIRITKHSTDISILFQGFPGYEGKDSNKFPDTIKPISGQGSVSTPTENLLFSDVFRRYTNGTLT